MAALNRGPLQLGDRVCDAAVVAFALWTLTTHASVALGLGLSQLELAAGVGALALGFVAWRRRDDPRADTSEPAADESPWPSPWLRAGVAALALACGSAYVLQAPLQWVWSLALAAALVAATSELLARPSPENARPEPSMAPLEAPSNLLFLGALSLFCIGATLLTHRPDPDDAFYLNLAVSAADHPSQPLLSSDTLHGVAGVKMILPVYKVHSLELLVGAISHLSGLAVLSIAHLLVPALFALAVPFAYARLLRLLIPGYWLFGVAIAIGYLALVGDGTHGWANLGLVRLHQGKAVLLTLGVPLLAAFAIEFARRPSAASFGRLAAAQIAAVGLSASALWLAPTLSAVALLAGCDGKGLRTSAKTLLLGLCASLYVLALALVLRSATEAAFLNAAVPGPETAAPSVQLARQAIRASMGAQTMSAISLAAVIGAWSVASSSVARRFAALSALCWLVFWNPFAASWIATHVTSAPTYWRTFWLIPMPVVAAIAVCAALRIGGAGRPWIGIGAALSLAAIALGAAPRLYALSARNQVELRSPGWQVPELELEIAQVMTRIAGPAAKVLAPRDVAPWIPTLHRHPYPLVVRPAYLPVLNGHVENRELGERIALLRFVSGERRPPHAGELLRSAIDNHDLRVIALTHSSTRWPDLRELLQTLHFEAVFENDGYEVWASVPERADPAESGDVH